MDARKYALELDSVRNANAMLKLALGALVVAIVVMAILLWQASTTQTVVVVPATLEHPAKFINGIPSDDYVREVATDFANLALTYTPATARRQFAALLKYYLPADYHKAYEDWMGLADKIERTGLSSVFSMLKLELKPHDHVIEFYGERMKYMDAEILKRTKAKYTLTYTIQRGAVFIVSFKEEGSVK